MHVEGGIYHVYNRLARGAMVFKEDTEAETFVSLLRDVKERDGLTLFAWCLMSNHYHLALRVGKTPLSRTMQSLQQRVTRAVNERQRVFGPLWQGRFKAKPILDQRYLDQLLVYIHLNPVSAGLVDDPAGHRWSGHREIVDLRRSAIIDTDEVLRLFGHTRRRARAAYVRQLRGALEEPWIGEGPGRLPWWRLGRPSKEDDDDPEQSHRDRLESERLSPDDRPTLTAAAFIETGAEILGVSTVDIRSRGKDTAVVRARETLALLGVERYGLRVKDLAQAMKKSPDGISKAIARAREARREDEKHVEALNELDHAIAARR